MCYTDGDACDIWNEKTVRAVKPHRCDECSGDIPVGCVHLRIGSLFEGEWDTLRVHVSCMALWRFVHKEVCDGEGFILVGGLATEIGEQDDYDGPDPEDPSADSTKSTLEWLYELATELGREAKNP